MELGLSVGSNQVLIGQQLDEYMGQGRRGAGAEIGNLVSWQCRQSVGNPSSTEISQNLICSRDQFSPRIRLQVCTEYDGIFVGTAASLLLAEINLSPAWISNYIHFKIWGEITYLFLNSIPRFTGDMINYTCWDRPLIRKSYDYV